MEGYLTRSIFLRKQCAAFSWLGRVSTVGLDDLGQSKLHMFDWKDYKAQRFSKLHNFRWPGCPGRLIAARSSTPTYRARGHIGRVTSFYQTYFLALGVRYVCFWVQLIGVRRPMCCIDVMTDFLALLWFLFFYLQVTSNSRLKVSAIVKFQFNKTKSYALVLTSDFR